MAAIKDQIIDALSSSMQSSILVGNTAADQAA
jgi:hypothetical protein